MKGVYLVRLSNLTDDLPSRWVDSGEGFPTGGILPLVVDKELKR